VPQSKEVRPVRPRLCIPPVSLFAVVADKALGSGGNPRPTAPVARVAIPKRKIGLPQETGTPCGMPRKPRVTMYVESHSWRIENRLPVTASIGPGVPLKTDPLMVSPSISNEVAPVELSGYGQQNRALRIKGVRFRCRFRDSLVTRPCFGPVQAFDYPQPAQIRRRSNGGFSDTVQAALKPMSSTTAGAVAKRPITRLSSSRRCHCWRSRRTTQTDLGTSPRDLYEIRPGVPRSMRGGTQHERESAECDRATVVRPEMCGL